MIGLHLSQYQIDAELGRGGMGIVYRATDTKLNRTVALKVLPASALTSEEDRARFYREAQAAAQLHHPNIATVFQIDEAVPTDADGGAITGQDEKRPFIAMEFVQGDTLADHISRAPLKLSEAVSIAAQIAEALKAAHAKQIVHRDIKSANVMLTADGVAKVLDFGLAKTQASTLLTRQGSTLGTIAYMSPEQARGQEVDGRSDLYSLGTVLYEMIAGRRPFAGDYEQAVIYGILNEPPEPLTGLRTGVPMGLEWIVEKLLSKEPRHRYQTAADLIADLETVDLTGSGHSRRSMSATKSIGAVPSAPRRSMPARMWVLVLGALLVGAAGAWFARTPVPVSTRVFDRPMTGLTAAALSHAGSRYAYVQEDTLYVRDLAALEPRVVGPAPGAGHLTWSPDDEQIAWAEGADVRRTRVGGERPETVTTVEAGLVYGLTWLPSNELLMSVRSGTGTGEILSIPSTGGRTTVFRSRDADADMKSFEYLSWSDEASAVFAVVLNREALPVIYLLSDEGDTILVPARREMIESVTEGSGGVLLVSDSDGLWAFRLASDFSSVVGPPVRVASSGAIQPSIAIDGTLMYIQTDVPSFQVRWMEPDGSPGSVLGQPSWYLGNPIVHPDEDRVLLTRNFSGPWILDNRGAATPIESGFNGPEEAFAWLPDGRRAVLASFRSGNAGLHVVDVSGGKPTQPLVVGMAKGAWGASLDRDGKRMAYYSVTTDRRRDLGYADLEIHPDTVVLSGGPHVYLSTPADETSPAVHPDGNWLAYQTNASGRWEIVVRSFPDPERSFLPVTSDGGSLPRWSPRGDLLYYEGVDGYLWTVPIDASNDPPTVGEGRRLFHLTPSLRRTPYEARYAISPVSGKIVAIEAAGEPAPPVLTTLLNWSLTDDR